MPPITGIPDAPRDRIDDPRVERVVQHVVLFRYGPVDVPAEAEVQRQLAVEAPVVLNPGRHEKPLVVWLRVDVHGPVGRRAEQEGGEGVPLQRVVDVQRALREVTVEIQKAARVVVVLVEDVGPPHVETAADVVRAAHHRHVGLNRVVAVPVGRRAAGEGREIGTRDPREEAADLLGLASARRDSRARTPSSRSRSRTPNSSTRGSKCSWRAG